MGRSIPSFRQLLEIEKLKMTSFKKILPSKKDKQESDEVFVNVRLYTSYLGNASNPIPLESVFMGAVFYNYKQLLQITKEDVAIDERTLEDELISLLEDKPEDTILFYRFSQKWHGFLYSLHKEDRLILLKMVLEVCSYDKCTINMINIQDSQSSIDFNSLLLTMIQYQKRINKANGEHGSKEITLFDFMSS